MADDVALAEQMALPWIETAGYIQCQVAVGGLPQLSRYIGSSDRVKIDDAEKAVEIIKKRTRYIRGMNIIMVNDNGIFVSSYFTEDDLYFTMRYREGHELVICSASFPGEENWHPIANLSMRIW